MLFTEPLFFAFFLLIFGLYWALPTNRSRKVLLLAGSYVFYGAWDWRFLFLILASTSVDFLVGLLLSHSKPKGGRRLWLVMSLIANLGILGFFKYFNFFVASTQDLLSLVGFDPGLRTLSIILPVGISFFTFQSMSYTIDVYRGKLIPIRSFLDFSLFVAFFPQLVAGPIVRASSFLPQLRQKRSFSSVRVKAMLFLFLVGYVKKVCLADNFAVLVDQVFRDPAIYDAKSVWLSMLSYTLQLYGDFSGYSDMAVATAGLLGYELTINFKHPYFSGNLSEFWTRWHVSLSTWLRDYLYIPMGGSRGTRVQVLRNLFVTMILGGLWHGAGLNFMLYGAIHGVGLVIHRTHVGLTQGIRNKRSYRIVFFILGPVVTMYVFMASLLVFRSESVEGALYMLRAYAFLGTDGEASLDLRVFLIFIPVLIIHGLTYRFAGSRWVDRVPGWLFAPAYGFLIAFILPFIPVSYKPFIYFQF